MTDDRAAHRLKQRFPDFSDNPGEEGLKKSRHLISFGMIFREILVPILRAEKEIWMKCD
jgi:hypothetical protein